MHVHMVLSNVDELSRIVPIPFNDNVEAEIYIVDRCPTYTLAIWPSLFFFLSSVVTLFQSTAG